MSLTTGPGGRAGSLRLRHPAAPSRPAQYAAAAPSATHPPGPHLVLQVGQPQAAPAGKPVIRVHRHEPRLSGQQTLAVEPALINGIRRKAATSARPSRSMAASCPQFAITTSIGIASSLPLVSGQDQGGKEASPSDLSATASTASSTPARWARRVAASIASKAIRASSEERTAGGRRRQRFSSSAPAVEHPNGVQAPDRTRQGIGCSMPSRSAA